MFSCFGISPRTEGTRSIIIYPNTWCLYEDRIKAPYTQYEACFRCEYRNAAGCMIHRCEDRYYEASIFQILINLTPSYSNFS